MLSMKKAVSVLMMALLVLTSGMAVAQEATPDATPASEEEQISRAISFYPEETGAGTFITMELRAGSTGVANVILGNSGNIEQVLRTYAVPVSSDVNGGFALASYDTEPDEITSWVNYPEQSFKLKPTEGLIIPVEITVPEETGPGEYVTAVAAEQSESFDIPGTDMMRQRVRWSVPILIVVPGEQTPAFELGDAQLRWQDGHMMADIDIANTGNVILQPAGEVRLLDSTGTVVGVAKVEMSSVYTGTETIVATVWQITDPSDSYSLEINLTAEDNTVSQTVTIKDLTPQMGENGGATEAPESMLFSKVELVPLTRDTPPSTLQFNGVIANNGEPIENARVSIVTYQDGVEVDRYPIMQAVTIQQGETPVEARYSLPGGFTDGTYTFEVTIELGDAGTQTVLVTQPIDFEVVVP